MKSGTSTLNPHASSYIPLSRREAADVNKDHSLTTEDHKRKDEYVCSKVDVAHSQKDSESSKNYVKHGSMTPADCSLKGSTVHSSYASSSQGPNDITKQYIGNEECDMDLAYLQMSFPDISEDSIFGVYVACQGDLEATIDMLDQLEEDDFSECHTEMTSTTKNVSESGSASGLASSSSPPNQISSSPSS